MISIFGTGTSANLRTSANYNFGTNAKYGTSAKNVIGTSAGTSALGNVGKILNYEQYKSFNYIYETTTWNKLMHINNGNIRRNITLGHWNGGSSYMDNSLRGREKFESIKEILTSNDIDILGKKFSCLLKRKEV